MLGSDKGGSEYNEIWGKAISDSLRSEKEFDKIQFVGLSDLSSVPFFMKWVIKGKFPDEKEKWVLMDWDGVFPEAFNFTEDAANILVFNTERKLIYQSFFKELDNNKLDEIIFELKKTIK